MKILKFAGYGIAVLIAMLAGVIVLGSQQTEREIEQFQRRVAELGATVPAPSLEPARVAELPEPVRRYFDFTFHGALPSHSVVRLEAAGQFRRPLTEQFNDTTAEQVIALGTPALMFSATTSLLPGVWARAYDFFAQGEMEMKAKVMSTLTVLDQESTPELNRISLRRWLLESALYPQTLLPGGTVSWEAIDESSARAVVVAAGLQASMIALFDAQGRMTHMFAEQEGDLSTPYHGSGEHVAREDYQAVGNQMIPMRFTISRSADGELYPFWDGRITTILFE